MKSILDNPHINKNGVTIKELKKLIMCLPETDEYGNEFTVWYENQRGLTDIVTEVWALNKSKDGCDILFTHRFDKIGWKTTYGYSKLVGQESVRAEQINDDG